jgi:hypothetical protein
MDKVEIVLTRIEDINERLDRIESKLDAACGSEKAFNQFIDNTKIHLMMIWSTIGASLLLIANKAL